MHEIHSLLTYIYVQQPFNLFVKFDADFTTLSCHQRNCCSFTSPLHNSQPRSFRRMILHVLPRNCYNHISHYHTRISSIPPNMGMQAALCIRRNFKLASRSGGPIRDPRWDHVTRLLTISTVTKTVPLLINGNLSNIRICS